MRKLLPGQLRQLPPHAGNDRIHGTQILQALPFRAFAQLFELQLFLPRPQRFEEQPRMLDHALPHRSRCLLVMRVPLRQVARGQMFGDSGVQKGGGVRGIGARQRRQHPRRGPAGDHALAYAGQAFLRHARQ